MRRVTTLLLCMLGPVFPAAGQPIGAAATGPMPETFRLLQNFPNPFNPETLIQYELDAAGTVSLRVYDVLGREVAVLVSEQKPAGMYVTRWDGRNSRGVPVPSGMYLYRLEVDGVAAVRTMLLLR